MSMIIGEGFNMGRYLLLLFVISSLSLVELMDCAMERFDTAAIRSTRTDVRNIKVTADKTFDEIKKQKASLTSIQNEFKEVRSDLIRIKESLEEIKLFVKGNNITTKTEADEHQPTQSTIAFKSEGDVNETMLESDVVKELNIIRPAISTTTISTTSKPNSLKNSELPATPKRPLESESTRKW